MNAPDQALASKRDQAMRLAAVPERGTAATAQVR